MRTIKGQIVSVITMRPVKLYKDSGLELFKCVETRYRAGIEHDNRVVVKEARADGTLPAENAGTERAGRKFTEYPYFLTDTKTETQTYYRFYPAPGTKAKVWYLDKDNVEHEFKTVKHLFLASELREGKPQDCYDIKEQNILQIGEVLNTDEKSLEVV
jgi:hypothetical protein